MTPCLFETYMACRCAKTWTFRPPMTNHLFKNPRCDRRARESAFFETPAGFALTYARMITLSGRYAEALAELGLKPGDRVAAQGKKTVEAGRLYLGAIRAGAIFLPVDTA
jgi:malonyl-CoA/methylmalonyl-CoA synthetase